VTDGKQRITATGAQAADAIEKVVTVRPDGREISVTGNALMNSSSDLDLEIPERSIEGSLSAELKIYPNLISHVIDGIEGILRRPYGCAEQTISASYPNLMILRYLQHSDSQQHRALREKAQRNLQSGIDRLLGYRNEDGSISYWGRGVGDVPLTAYALTFLTQAKQFVIVDDDLIQDSRRWLVKHQEEEGAWLAFSFRKAGEIDPRRTAYQTAAAALALASAGTPDDDALLGATRALTYLSRTVGGIDEPYLSAVTALVAKSAGQPAIANEMLNTLRRLTRRENDLVYWNIETNTPFYGWGLAGRLETTAIAVRALVQAGEPADQALIDAGMLFLLRNKDRFGVWHSTQATVNVLEAILAANRGAVITESPSPAEVLDRRQARDVDCPATRLGTHRSHTSRPVAISSPAAGIRSRFAVRQIRAPCRFNSRPPITSLGAIRNQRQPLLRRTPPYALP
jgi:hypothetical protein